MKKKYVLSRARIVSYSIVSKYAYKISVTNHDVLFLVYLLGKVPKRVKTKLSRKALFENPIGEMVGHEL